MRVHSGLFSRFFQYFCAEKITQGHLFAFIISAWVKHYSNPGEAKQAQKRYSPSQFVSADKRRIAGDPDVKAVSTSHVERQNLTMRMGMRRFTRLTNGFSKKIENLECAVALHFMYYNFGRIHKTLRVTPAMQAGVADHVWSLEEIASLTDL